MRNKIQQSLVIFRSYIPEECTDLMESCVLEEPRPILTIIRA